MSTEELAVVEGLVNKLVHNHDAQIKEHHTHIEWLRERVQWLETELRRTNNSLSWHREQE